MGDRIDVWVEVFVDEDIEAQFGSKKRRVVSRSAAMEAEDFVVPTSFELAKCTSNDYLRCLRALRDMNSNGNGITAEENDEVESRGRKRGRSSGATESPDDPTDNLTLPVYFPDIGVDLQVSVKRIFPANQESVIALSDDLTTLTFLEEANVLNLIGLRFENRKIYTSISDVIVAVNPCQRLDIYTQNTMNAYKDVLDIHHSEPHLYKAAEEAFRELTSAIPVTSNPKIPRNQSMVVCGESGSGKTESAKHIMRYLGNRSAIGHASTPSDHVPIEQQVVDTNLILEALGNAKTNLNHNSSRFGKFTKMYFKTANMQPDFDEAKMDSYENRIMGAATETYLLEKSRVVLQNPGERNFHAFYGVIDAASSDHGRDLPNYNPQHLGFDKMTVIDFNYTNQGLDEGFKDNEMDSDGMTHGQRFLDMLEGMHTLNISLEEQQRVIEIIAGLLHLGNVETIEAAGDKAEVSVGGEKHLSHASRLLGVDKDDLRARILTEKLDIKGQKITKELNEIDSIHARDSIAKLVYENLFIYTVHQINTALALRQGDEKKVNKELPWIGILDVFGFEVFQNNSFEQFCINFANESLQQHFNNSILLSQQKEYTKEGIVWEPLELPDGSSTIDLIENRATGILAVLDGACRLKPNAAGFIETLFDMHPKSAILKPLAGYIKVKAKHVAHGFLLKHFAEPVIYNADEFIPKNKDKSDPDAVEMFTQRASNTLVNEMFHHSNQVKAAAALMEASGGRSRSKSVNAQTVSKAFASQLKSLRATLGATSSYFIRCVKPNKSFTPFLPDKLHIRPQLRCGGVVEAVKMLKRGYPIKIDYSNMYGQFLPLIEDGSTVKSRIESGSKRDFCVAILSIFGITSGFQLGRTKIFFRADLAPTVHTLRSHNIDLSGEQMTDVRKFLVKLKLRRAAHAIRCGSKWFIIIRRKRAVNLLRKVIRVYGKVLASFPKLLNSKRIQNKSLHEKQMLKKEEQDRLRREREEAERLRQEELSKFRERQLDLEKKKKHLEVTIRGLESELEASQQDIKNLEDEGRGYRDQIDRATSRTRDLEGEIDTLRRQLNKVDGDRGSALREISVLKDDYESEHRKNAILREQVEQQERDVAKLRGSLAESEQILAGLKSDSDTATREIAALRADKDELERRLGGVSEDNDINLRELITLRADVEESERRIGALKEERDSALRTTGNLRVDLDDSLAHLATIKLERDESARTVASLKAESDDMERLLNSMKSDKDAQKREIAQLRETGDETSRTISKLKHERDDILAGLNSGRGDLEQALRKITNLKEAQEEAASEISSLKAERDGFRKTGSTNRIELLEAQRQIAESNANVDELKAALLRTQEEREEAIRSSATLKANLVSLNKQVSSLGEEIEDQRRIMSTLTVERDDLVEKLASASEGSNDSHIRSAQILSEQAASRRELGALKVERDNLNTSLTSLKERITDSESKRVLLLQQSEELSRKNRMLKDERDSSTRSLMNLKTLYSETQQNMAILKSTLESYELQLLEVTNDADDGARRTALLSAEISALEEQILILKSDKDASKVTLRGVMDERDQLQRQVNAVQNQKDELDDAAKMVQGEYALIEASYATLRTERDELVRSIAKNKTDSEVLNRRIDITESERLQLEKDLVQAQREKAEARGEITNIMVINEELVKKIAELESSSGNYAKKLDLLQSKYDERFRESSELKGRLEEVLRAQENTRIEKNEIVSKLNSMKSERDSAMNETSVLVAERDSALQACSARENESVELRDNISMLKEHTEDIESQLHRLTLELEVSESKSAAFNSLELALNAEIRSLKEANDDARINMTSMNEMLTISKKEAAVHKQAKEDNLREVNKLKRDSDAIQRRVIQSRDERQSLERQLKALRSENDDFVRQVSSLQDDRERFSGQESLLKMKNSQMDMEIKHLKEDLVRIREQLIVSENERDEAQRQLASTRDNSKDLKSHLKKLQAEQMDAETRLRALKADLASKSNLLDEQREMQRQVTRELSLEKIETRKQIRSMEDSHNRATNESSILREEFTRLSTALQLKEQELKDMEIQMTAIIHSKESSELENEKLRATVYAQESASETLLKQRSIASIELQAACEERDAAISKINELRYDQDKLSRTAAESKDVISGKKKELESLTIMNTELRQQLGTSRDEKEQLLIEKKRIATQLEDAEKNIERMRMDQEATKQKLSSLYNLLG